MKEELEKVEVLMKLNQLSLSALKKLLDWAEGRNLPKPAETQKP